MSADLIAHRVSLFSFDQRFFALPWRRSVPVLAMGLALAISLVAPLASAAASGAGSDGHNNASGDVQTAAMQERAGDDIPMARDFSADAKLTSDAPMPIMLLVSQSDCGYCMQLKEEILEPMIRSGDYESEVLFREILIDDEHLVRDFDGEEKDPADIAERYRAWVTPTLLFLDPRGRQVADKMVGVNTIEMYGYYVDQSILESQAAINAASRPD